MNAKNCKNCLCQFVPSHTKAIFCSFDCCFSWRRKNVWKTAKIHWFEKDKIREYHRIYFKKWKENNLEKNRSYSRKGYRKLKEQNPDLLRARQRASYNNRRAREKDADGVINAETWLEIKRCYDFTCLCCGKKEPEIHLVLEHVRPLSRGGSNDPDNIQPLCGRCNSIKFTKIIDYRLPS